MSVLIVDDEQLVRGAVKRLLERERMVRVVGEAGDGEEAVRLARELRPDVVLMDIAMPRLDGLEATRRIKAERPEAKVIILTVHREEAYRRAAAESGADAFLPKKAPIDDLLLTIRRLGSSGEASPELEPGDGRKTEGLPLLLDSGDSEGGYTTCPPERGGGDEPTDPGGRG